MDSVVQSILQILGSSLVTATVTYLFARRKIKAETKSQEVDADNKISDFIEEMRGKYVDLSRANVDLEKKVTDQARQIEILTSRLEARDKQLEAATKQLDLLRDLAKEAPITETLRTQLDAVNQFAANSQTMFQTMQTDLSKLLLEKEAALQELLRTNNDLRLKKPAKPL